MGAKKPENIMKLKKTGRSYFVLAVFALILIYLVIQIWLAFTKESVQAYNIGSAGTDRSIGIRTAVVLRDETVYTADSSGYVGFYVLEGDRVREGDILLHLDPDGDMEEKLHAAFDGQTAIGQDGMLRVRNAMKDATELYDRSRFTTLLSEKSMIRTSVLEQLVKEHGSEVLEQQGISYQTVSSQSTGFLMNWCDGLEGTEPEALTDDAFSENASLLKRRNNGDLVEEGDFLYKIADSNKFRLVFLLEEGETELLCERKTLTVSVNGEDEITGTFTVSENADGSRIGILEFKKYGVNYLNARTVSVEILDTTVSGFKIPESSIVTREVYIVDESFIDINGALNEVGVMRFKDGKAYFVSCTVYRKKGTDENSFIIGDDVAYILPGEIEAGDVLIKDVTDADGTMRQETFTVGAATSIEGVYQINDGYCVFKPIVRIQNSVDTAYVIISAKVSGGLSAFDRIVLNAAEVTEREIIY